MMIFDKLAGKLYKKVFDIRYDIRPGISYFDESHFKGLIKDDFSFRNENGYLLNGGFYHYDTYKEDTLVIFCHGFGGGHQAYMKEIEYLARNGFKVLAIDYQGSVLSEGDGIGGFSQALKDMYQCLNIVKKDYKNIYVAGHSWGGWVASGLTYLDKDIKKAVIISGMSSIANTLNHFLVFPLSIFKHGALKKEYDRYGDYSLLSAVQTLNRSDLEVYHIHSKDDKMLPYKHHINKVIKENTNPCYEYHLVDGKNHNPTYTVESLHKLNDYLKKLKRLKNIDEIKALEASISWDDLYDLDTKVMDEIIEFLNR